MTHPTLPSRRRFLQTIGFSAAALLTERLHLRAAAPVDPRARHMFLFGDWGAQESTEAQQQVAGAMGAYAKAQGIIWK